MDERPGRTSITWRLPGGMSIVYSGTRKPYGEWVIATFPGYLAMWSIWLRCARALVDAGAPPTPRLVTKLACRTFKTIVDRCLERAREDRAA